MPALRRAREALICVAVAGVVGAASCNRAESTGAFLAGNRDRYGAVIERATVWLTALPVDPVELRKRGQKGKKHFVEALDAYRHLMAVASPERRAMLLERVRALVSVTERDDYHDMLTNDDVAFKQDATSYLRAAVLLERLGVDTTRYRAEIAKMKPRLDGQMRERGVNQRMVFATYYEHFGLAQPFNLAAAVEDGVLASRKPAEQLTRLELYDLTHEVFAPYEFGDKLDAHPFDDDQQRYLRVTLARLIEQRIHADDPDAVAELVSCMVFLKLEDEPEYVDGLRFLLASQHPDGTWGDYERERRRVGDVVKQAYELHTVGVVVEALTEAFAT